MSSGFRFLTWARVTAVAEEALALVVPGGWPEVRVPFTSLPDWMRSAAVGQYVLCTMRTLNDEIELGEWQYFLPMGLEPHRFRVDEYEALPEAKLELIHGMLYIDDAARAVMLAALASNVGLVEVVRLAPEELWRQALAQVRRDQGS